MGLLDDAIREHLELKRRRGADPTEIERAEREALGPVRRQPEPIQDASFPEEAGLPGEPALGQEPDYALPLEDEHPLIGGPAQHWPQEDPHGALPAEPWAGDEVALPPPAAAPWPHEESVPAPAPERLPGEEPSGATPAEHWPDEAPPAPHGAPNPADPTAHLHQETAEYDVGFDHPEHPEHTEPEKQGEDMLEETPEFLQDTPDHDRLWFEQRPPRDFDFDE